MLLFFAGLAYCFCIYKGAKAADIEFEERNR